MNLGDAIRLRQIIQFEYDGLPRTAQPATLGYTTTGKLSLRACLIDGNSRRNAIPCWELYSVAKISRLATSGSTFAEFTLTGYTRGDSAFSSIIAEH